MSIPKQVIKSFYINITDKCNFHCVHCFNNGPSQPKHMSVEDAVLAAQKAANPFLKYITVNGGEPTLHPEFDGLTRAMVKALTEKGMVVPMPDIQKGDEQKIKHADYEASKLFSDLKRRKSNEINTGEWLRIKDRITAEQAPHVVKIDLQTNGWLMLKNLDTLIEETQRLMKAGFYSVLISTDLAHTEYAQRAGLNLDYRVIKGYAYSTGDLFDKRNFRQIRQKLRNKSNRLCESGNGEYVVPIGAAKKLPWTELLRLAQNISDFGKLQRQLETEYSYWDKMMYFSHSAYCTLAHFFRTYKKVQYYSKENSIHPWGAVLSPDLTAHLCMFKIIPPLGNLRENDFEQMYIAALNNPVYRIIGEEGPQGLARRLGWKESEIRKSFVERTPCGLCEDIFAQQKNYHFNN
jgi:organic radical activating enzyme